MNIWPIIAATVAMLPGTSTPSGGARSQLSPSAEQAAAESLGNGRFETLEVQDGGFIIRTYSTDQSARVALTRTVHVKDATVRTPMIVNATALPETNAAVESPDGRLIAVSVTYQNSEHQPADLVYIIDIPRSAIVHVIVPPSTSAGGKVVPVPKNDRVVVANCTWTTSDQLRIWVTSYYVEEVWGRVDTVSLAGGTVHVTYGPHIQHDVPSAYSHLVDGAAAWFVALGMFPTSPNDIRALSQEMFGRYRGVGLGAVSADGVYAVGQLSGPVEGHGSCDYLELLRSGKEAAKIIDIDTKNSRQLTLVPHALVAVMYQGPPIIIPMLFDHPQQLHPFHHYIDVWSLDTHKFSAQHLPGDLLVDTAAYAGK